MKYQVGVQLTVCEEYVDRITCPLCKYEDQDSWEHNDSSEWSCGKCGAECDLRVEHSTTYNTYLKVQK